ncbi:ATP-binding protein [Pontibacter sp. SGAir0037]|uniref:ATP-binding protein n=1 Tax=Pontibacter sp. SGAir0037 TaxID=2571030 RepID=UPI0010CCC4AA|nr:ATP-binding protein [Pontibacter sp. SGAir0037]QCR24163.1 histidine kinase [Pontibacter sp. SGAir0037]
MPALKVTTKTKVITGFSLALSVIVVALHLTYSSFTQLLHSVSILSQPNVKLVKLQHTLADMATAESSIRAYTLTTNNKHLDAYLSNMETVDCQIDSLRLFFARTQAERLQVDSVSALLQAKKQRLEQYIALKKQHRDYNYSGEVMQQIASSAVNPPKATTIKRSTTTTISERAATEDTKPQAEEKNRRSLLSRIFSKKPEEPKPEEAPALKSIPQVTVRQNTSVDSSKASTTEVAELGQVRRILNDVQRKANRNESMLLKQELALLQQDKQIMDKIRAMIYKLEQHELKQAAVNSAHAKKVAHNTSLTLLLIGVFGLVIGIAFILLILRDITRSNLYKKQLIRARKEAVQLARTKEAFLANMSHEIRTPLHTVLGYAEQLKNSPLQLQQQEQLQAIHNAGEHLLHIANDVLDLSKLEAGKVQVQITEFSLPTLLQEVEQAFVLKAKGKGIGFRIELSEQLQQPLQGDPVCLKQVLFNLADNAIKFTHQGEVCIQAHLKSERRGIMVVEIVVSDTGIGIPPEKVEHIFGEFNQADSSIIRQYGGTGLGLAISKRLAEMQNGGLYLQSTPGKGSAFSLILSMRKGNRIAASASKAPVRQAQETLKSKQVLVIDDDAYSRNLCEMVLQRWGAIVTLAEDGYAALEAVSRQAFDLVLTDIQLPGMSGKALARAIRKKNPHIPIVALTANIMSNSSNFFAKTGISDYLLKPFSEQALLHTLTKAISQASTEPMKQHAQKPQHNKQTETPAAPPLYDLTEMRLFAGNDQEALLAILEVLVTDHHQNLKKLAQAFDEGNWQGLGIVAHKMLTAFKHLKAHHIADPLLKLEQLLHQENTPDKAQLEKLVKHLQLSITLVLDNLRQEIKQLSARELEV